MSSLVWLAVAVALIGVVALTRAVPKGGNPVGNTHLMGMARWILVLGVVVCGALGILSAVRH